MAGKQQVFTKGIRPMIVIGFLALHTTIRWPLFDNVFVNPSGPARFRRSANLPGVREV